VAIKAIAHDLPGAQARLDGEAQRDRSDRGRRALIRAEASVPRREAKESVWQRIHGEGYGSFHFTRAAMQGFFWLNQADILEPYAGRFFEQVRHVFEERDHPFARAYVLAMFPAYRADPQVLERSRRLLGSLNGQQPTLSRQLAEVADELERSIRVRTYAER
jgi:aminopeptidase N